MPEGLHALEQDQDGEVDGDDHQQAGNDAFSEVPHCLVHVRYLFWMGRMAQDFSRLEAELDAGALKNSTANVDV
ncbi:hypothetical protein PMHK_49250 [Pseudomonas sp. MHK4]